MNVLEEFKNYKRDFIMINSDTAMLIHIFTKDIEHSLEDIILEDHEQYIKDITSIYKKSAKQLFKQFEGNDCISFVKALRNECNNVLKKDKKRKAKITKLYENHRNKRHTR